ncbi:MAG: hypothetical protein H6613_18435 [Ignavibacteriales bacterium]|nr:hypothetical protein [Ignavibacteriales bacterium]
MKLVGDKEIPVEGINVILKKHNSDEVIKIRTMSDGSYYQYGIEPGNYKIYIDETQLERIKLKSYPEKNRNKSLLNKLRKLQQRF